MDVDYFNVKNPQGQFTHCPCYKQPGKMCVKSCFCCSLLFWAELLVCCPLFGRMISQVDNKKPYLFNKRCLNMFHSKSWKRELVYQSESPGQNRQFVSRRDSLTFAIL